jgi:hypothetical protein
LGHVKKWSYTGFFVAGDKQKKFFFVAGDTFLSLIPEFLSLFSGRKVTNEKNFFFLKQKIKNCVAKKKIISTFKKAELQPADSGLQASNRCTMATTMNST